MNTQFIIEKNVPEPGKRSCKSNPYPLREMQIGDSFFAPSELATALKVWFVIIYFQIRNQGFRFSVRKVAGGVRVWRVESEATDWHHPCEHL